MQGSVAKAKAAAKAKSKARAKAKSACIPLMSNQIAAQALDRSLLNSLECGISAFRQPGRGTRVLERGESRVEKEAQDLPPALTADGQLCRIFVEGDYGAGPKTLYAPKCNQRELHTLADCGSSAFGASLWLHTGGKAFGSHATDLYAHDCHNSVKAACTATGVWLLVLEYGLLASWRRGPFKSMASGEKFIDAAKDLIAFIRADNYADEVWLTFYVDIAKQLGLWYGSHAAKRYSAEHFELVLLTCENHFLNSLGDPKKQKIKFNTERLNT